MFILSKLFWAIAQPFTILIILLAVSAFMGSIKLVRIIVAVLLILGISPIVPWAAHSFERIYAKPESLNSNDFDVIAVLGGAIELRTKADEGYPQLSAYAERLTEGLSLSQQFPDRKVVFLGGAGASEHPDLNEAAQVKVLIQKLNIPSQNIVFEGNSRNTVQNSEGLKSVGYKEGSRVLLVTSAFHMPRSVMIFEGQGFKIIPYPVGFMEDDQLSLWPDLNLLGKFTKLNIVVKEFIGMMAFAIQKKV
jgi:uncharacterized SAM-binding protein YcdF (DUF218 family)